MTEEEECISFCSDNEITVISDYEKSEITGIPTYRSLIQAAKDFSETNDVICQINSDIILCDDFSETVKSFREQMNYEKYALVGQRFDCDFDNSLIDFSTDWQKDLPDGQWHPSCGIDYFAFSKSTFDELPKFFVARFTYDGWLLGHLTRNSIPTFDCTNTIKAYHQNHGYGEEGNMDYHEHVEKNKLEISFNSQYVHSVNIDNINGRSVKTTDDKIYFEI